MQKRRCQIYASFPITCFTVPIVGHTELNLTEEEIYKCLCAKAQIDEILPNGKRVALNFSNYKRVEEPVKPVEVKVECPIIEAVKVIKEEVQPEPVVEPTLPEVEPVIEEEQEVVETTTEEVIESTEEVLEEEITEPVVEEVVEDEDLEEEESEDEEETVEEVVSKNDNPVRTHELSSRNNYPTKNKKHKNRR